MYLMNLDNFRVADMSKGKVNNDGYRGIHLYYQKVTVIIILKYKLILKKTGKLMIGYILIYINIQLIIMLELY